MKNYVAYFWAVYKGSQGRDSLHCQSVQAENKKEAGLKLYEDFEHIRLLRIKENDNE